MSQFMEVLNMMAARKGKFVSGQYMADKLGVSRESISNYIEKLKGLGYKIETHHARGSKLVGREPYNDVLDHTGLRFGLWGHLSFCREFYCKKLVSSTNTEGVKLALDGAREGTLVMADAQSNGKGRLGRKWVSPPGINVYMSIVLRPIIEPGFAPGLTLAAGVAVYDTVKELTGSKDIQLKWPNDILVNGKKIAGILTEMNAEADRVNFVVVGIGLNVNGTENDFPEEIRDIATSLKTESGKNFIRVEVVGNIIKNLRVQYSDYLDNGPSTVFKRWETRAKIKGKAVEVTTSKGKVKGIAAGLDPQGALKIKSASGTVQKVYEGDLRIL